MDPISLIVSALVSGILAGVTKSAQHAVHETYLDLRASIDRRYSGEDAVPLHDAIAALEEEPTALERQEAVAVELERVGAGEDPELQALASRLTSLIEDPMQGGMEDQAPRFASPVEEAHYHAGVRAVAKVMDRHLGALFSLRERLNLDDTDLLSATDSGKRDVPREVVDEVDRLRRDMREIIMDIAQRIEENNYRDAEQAIHDMPMARSERERAVSLVSADKRMHTSYRALQMVVEYFSELNQGVLDKIGREESPVREANMMLGNAIMIFELTDFVIRYVNQFRLDGSDDLTRLHESTKERINALREQQEALKDRASAPDIERAVREQTLGDIHARAAAVDALEEEWQKYLDEVATARSMIGQVESKIPTLEIIRDNARIQIDVLQLVAMLQFLKRNAEAVRGAIETLKGLRLAPLEPGRVRRLVGA